MGFLELNSTYLKRINLRYWSLNDKVSDIIALIFVELYFPGKWRIIRFSDHPHIRNKYLLSLFAGRCKRDVNLKIESDRCWLFDYLLRLTYNNSGNVALQLRGKTDFILIFVIGPLLDRIYVTSNEQISCQSNRGFPVRNVRLASVLWSSI